MADDIARQSAGRHRPKTTTVFVAAFVAGAVAAVVVNRALDLHLAQSRPQVESEPIFVALRAMPQGSPVTVWDVALRDWPRAMLPSTALRAGDSFEGTILKYPVREGQPLLAVQLMPAERPAQPAAVIEEAFVPPPPATTPVKIVKTEPVTTPPSSLANVPSSSPAAAPLPAASPNQKNDPVPPAPVEKPVAQETIAVTPPAADKPAVVAIVPEPSSTADTASTTPATQPESRKPFELEPTEPDAGSDETEASVASVETSKSKEPALVSEPEAPAPVPPKQEPTLVESDVEPLLDTPSRPAVDLEKIPSVMARSEKPAQPAEPSVSSNSVRYLVVPERIARQADTSFVPPPAVEPTPEPSPAPAALPPSKTTRSAQMSTPPVKGFPQRPGTPSTASRPRPKQPAPRASQQPQTQQPQKKAPTQAQVKQPNKQRQPQANPGPERSRTETAAKPREPMFPILAAGIEAMGTRWRGSDEDESAATDQPSQQRRK